MQNDRSSMETERDRDPMDEDRTIGYAEGEEFDEQDEADEEDDEEFTEDEEA